MIRRFITNCLGVVALVLVLTPLVFLVGFSTTADQKDLFYSGSEHHEQTTSNITTNGPGPTLNTMPHPHSMVTMMVDRTAGSTDAVAINLELSVDCVDWIQVTGAGDGFGPVSVTNLSFEPEEAHVNGFPFSCVRYNVVTVGTGNTLQIHLLVMR